MLGLLIAITAAVGPTVFTTLHERTFDSVMDVTSRQMLLARAHAQATGQMVEVIYIGTEEGTPQVVARLFSLEEDPQPTLPLGWAQRSLPHGYVMLDHEPQSGGTGIGGVTEQPVELSSLRLGVFLPDGSAMAGADHWVSDGDGRAARMMVNPYTGHVAFERLAPEDLRSAAARDGERLSWGEP